MVNCVYMSHKQEATFILSLRIDAGDPQLWGYQNLVPFAHLDPVYGPAKCELGVGGCCSSPRVWLAICEGLSGLASETRFLR